MPSFKIEKKCSGRYVTADITTESQHFDAWDPEEEGREGNGKNEGVNLMERPKELGKPLQDRWLSFPFQVKQLHFGTATVFHLNSLHFLNMLWAPCKNVATVCVWD